MSDQRTIPTLASASRRQLLGIVLICLAVLCFALLDSLSKLLTAYYAVASLVWVRYAVHTLLMVVAFGPRRGMGLIRTARPWMLVLRGLLLLACTVLMITGLRYIPLAEATAILYLSPLLVTLLSIPLLRERVDQRNWVAAVMGFIGVLIIVRPGSEVLTPAIALPLLAAVCNSLYQIVTRHLGGTESPVAMNFITGLVGVVVMSFAAGFTWTTPTPRHALLMVVMGAAGMAGHLLLIKAFQHASPATLAPFTYGHIAWAVLLGYLVFGALPDLGSVLGMCIIAACGLYIAFHRPPRRQSD